MKELIKITEKEGNSVVSARELYEFLEVSTRFNDWMKRMFEYGFTENVDYQVLLKNEYNLNGGRPLTNYALTLDTAKHIAMIQRSDKGMKAREYFINCEKKLIENKPALPTTYIGALEELLLKAKENEKLVSENKQQSETIQIQAPKAEYHDEVLKSTSTYTITQIAKELWLTSVNLNRRLFDLKIQYKQSGTWMLYKDYLDKGYTDTETFKYLDSNGETKTRMNTKWTEKGRKFIHELYDEGELN